MKPPAARNCHLVGFRGGTDVRTAADGAIYCEEAVAWVALAAVLGGVVLAAAVTVFADDLETVATTGFFADSVAA